MEIREFRVVVRARDFDATCRFYGEILSLPRIRSWDGDDGRGAVYHIGSGAIEVLGRARSAEKGRDRDYDYQGPDQKMTLTAIVTSAEQAYEEAVYRHRNIPGGLRQTGDGALLFETRDPDGVKIVFRQEPE